MGPAAGVERLTGLRRALTRRPLRAAVALAVAVVIAGAVVVTRGGGEDDPPAPLPLAGYTTASTGEVERQVAEDLPPGVGYVPPVFQFVPAGELPTLGGEAPAFRRTGDAGQAEFDELAELFGIEGRVDSSNGVRILNTGDEMLFLDRLGAWNYAWTPADDAPTVAPERAFGGTGTADGGLPEPLDEGDEVAPLEGLPSDDGARRIALDLLETTGADLDGAEVSISRGLTQVMVDVVPRVDGLLMPDALMYVAVGVDGRIANAVGSFADLDELGDYPLVDVPVALDRLSSGWEGGIPLADGAVARSTTSDPTAAGAGIPEVEVREVAVTHAELVLMSVEGWGGGAYAVPGYRVVAEDGSVAQVPAVVDELIDARDTTRG